MRGFRSWRARAWRFSQKRGEVGRLGGWLDFGGLGGEGVVVVKGCEGRVERRASHFLREAGLLVGRQ